MLKNKTDSICIDVALPLPLHKTFHYKITADQRKTLSCGSRVLVNFRNRKLYGYIIGFPEEGFDKAKHILDIPQPQPFFSQKTLEFFRWISLYYAYPLGEVIKAAIPTLSTKKLKKIKPYTFQKLETHRPVSLNEAQQAVHQRLKTSLDQQKFSPFLLHGVTGSGKTEIYLKIIEDALALKKQAIVLIPEISLTPQTLSRFEVAFGKNVGVLNSRLTPAQRHHEWMKIKNNEVSIVVGARSAIFAPFQNLGVIIVDEEHDGSFKQEEKLRYHARDVALLRGQLDRAIVILGSATPSLESTYNCEIKKFKKLSLPDRVAKRALPTVEIISLQNDDQKFGDTFIFTEPLLRALQQTLLQKSQAILLLNRRGYAPVLVCQSCGHISKCRHCSVTLTVYAKKQLLLCHYCSETQKIPAHCPDCDQGNLKSLGMGTEKVEDELQKLFPDARIARMDRSSTQKKNALENLLGQFSKGKIDILIGTQMVAKGHDFPNVTLVGVILADVALNLPDFRAPEKTFQLLTQVAGRAGRGTKPGQVIIQSFSPTHYALKHAKNHDFEGFYKEELEYRREVHYPPFSKIINFKISHANELMALEKMKQAGRLCQKAIESNPQLKDMEVLGPAAAPLTKIKGKFRFQLLVKSNTAQIRRLFLKILLTEEEFFRSAPKIHIDVDPLNLL